MQGSMTSRGASSSRSVNMTWSHMWMRHSPDVSAEDFGALSPMTIQFKVMKHGKIIVNGVEIEKTSYYKPRGMRWSRVRRNS